MHFLIVVRNCRFSCMCTLAPCVQHYIGMPHSLQFCFYVVKAFKALVEALLFPLLSSIQDLGKAILRGLLLLVPVLLGYYPHWVLIESKKEAVAVR